MWYFTGNPNEYIAVTGRGIKTVKICKSGMIWPFQKGMRFSVHPRDYAMSLRAMTKEKLQFELPVVFTVGPDVNQRGANDPQARDHSARHTPEDRGDALTKYAMLLADSAEVAKKSQTVDDHVARIVKGIIEGESRVLVSSMTMEELFNGRDQFKKRVSQSIQAELDQFGLKIYNANIRELLDAPDSSYFASLRQKAHEGATNQARVDVAEAQWHGNVGEAERRGKQDREIAKIHAETAVQKTERDTEKSQAEATLAQRKAAFDRDVSIAQIEATRATEVRDEELRKAVEIRKAETEIERGRATKVMKATVDREAKQQEATAKAFEIQAAADAELYRQKKAAEAQAFKVKTEAEASFAAAERQVEAHVFKTQRHADAAYAAAEKEAEADFVKRAKLAEADFIQRSKQADGIAKMAVAYAAMSKAFGGPQGLIQYLMVEKGIYQELARANAQAVQGMQPKMTIWNTGANAASGSKDGAKAGGDDPAAAIRNSYQMLPPLLSTIHEQTGLSLPEWQFGKLASMVNEREVASNGERYYDE